MGSSLYLPNSPLLFQFFDMNAKQAKTIPIPEFLVNWGLSLRASGELTTGTPVHFATKTRRPSRLMQ